MEPNKVRPVLQTQDSLWVKLVCHLNSCVYGKDLAGAIREESLFSHVDFPFTLCLLYPFTMGACPSVKSCFLQNSFFTRHSRVMLRGAAGEFPDTLVVRIPGFHCHGLGSIPGWGTGIPQASRSGQKWKKKSGEGSCWMQIKYPNASE